VSGPIADGRFLVDHPNATGINDDGSREGLVQLDEGLRVEGRPPRAVGA